MNRILKMSLFVLSFLFTTQTALAQVGLQTGQPTTTGSADVKLNVASTSDDTSECTITQGMWPLKGKTSADALCFWNQEDQEYLKYARFISSEKTFSASTEMVTDVFGTIRVAFSAAVAATTDDDTTTTTSQADGDDDEPTSDEDETLNLFKTNGGNLALTASYPVYYKQIGEGQLLWNSYLRFAANVDAMGGDSTEVTIDEDDLNGNLEVALAEIQLDLLSHQQKFNLLGYAKASGVVGTKKFAAALGDDVARSFIHAQVGAGVRVATQLTVYFNYNWYSDDDIPGSGGAITLVMGN